MAVNTMSSRPFILVPLAVFAVGTIAAFLVAINKNFDQLAGLWSQCSSSSSSSKLPTALCFAVLFFRTALNSTRSRLEEAAIIGFLGGLATITTVESTRYRRQWLVDATATRLPDNGKRETPNERNGISDNETSNKSTDLSSRITGNLAVPWLLYNLAAGALAWQAIIIPAFLYERIHSTERTVTTRSKSAKITKKSENIATVFGVALGLLAPSTLMILNPTSTATILFWLVFPLWVSVIKWSVQRVIPVSLDEKGNSETIKMGSMLMPYALPIIYSAISHFVLVQNIFIEADDRDPLTRATVLLLEIDHLAIFLAFLYWVWADTTTTTACKEVQHKRDSTLIFNHGVQAVLVTLFASCILGPGAGVCLGWVFSSVSFQHEHEQDRHSAMTRPLDEDALGSQSGRECSDDNCGTGGLGKLAPKEFVPPSTPVTNAGSCKSKARARSSPKATGHFFGGPLAD